MSGTQPLSCCAFLDFALELPQAEHLPTVVQINWAKVDEPMRGTDIMDKSGQRIWFLTQMSDITGSVQVGVPERCALALANCTGKEEFIQAHKAGQLQFPLFHNVRLTRTARSTSGAATGKATPASQDAGGSQDNTSVYVDHILEEVSTVGWTGADAPNAAYIDVVKIQSQCRRHDEALIFAGLTEMRDSPHYGFEVAMKEFVVHGRAVVALVGSREKSVVQQCGDGYKVTTKNIVDVLGNALGVGGTVAWDAVAYCGIDDLLEFKLDPPRGSSMRVAVATIIGLEKGESSRSVVLEKVQNIDAVELNGVTSAFKKLRTLGRQIKGSADDLENNKRHAMPVLLSPEPKKLKSRRTLQRSPTAASLPSSDVAEEETNEKCAGGGP